MKSYFYTFATVVCLVFAFQAGAQNNQSQNLATPSDKKDSVTDKNTFFPLPMVYYNPEAGLVYGVTTLYNFYIERKKPIRPSQIQPAVGHTTKNQLLIFVPFQLFWNRNNNYTYGDVNYYRFSYNFFGIGNDSNAEDYTAFRAHITRFFANSMKKVSPDIYAGGRLWYEHYSIGNRWHVRGDEDFDPAGLPPGFNQNEVPGGRFNRTLGIGGILVADTRDIVYYPMNGHFAEVFIQHHNKNTGSTHTFTTLSADLMYYKTFFEETVIATNLYTVFNFGEEVPFNRMARLGGNRKMRGFYEGFFTDNHGMALQAEIRQMLFWRIGITAFANAGQVASSMSDTGLSNFRFSYGGGLRFVFDKEKRVNLRFDYGMSALGTSGFYIAFNEAF